MEAFFICCCASRETKKNYFHLFCPHFILCLFNFIYNYFQYKENSYSLLLYCNQCLKYFHLSRNFILLFFFCIKRHFNIKMRITKKKMKRNLLSYLKTVISKYFNEKKKTIALILYLIPSYFVVKMLVAIKNVYFFTYRLIDK